MFNSFYYPLAIAFASSLLNVIIPSNILLVAMISGAVLAILLVHFFENKYFSKPEYKLNSFYCFSFSIMSFIHSMNCKGNLSVALFILGILFIVLFFAFLNTYIKYMNSFNEHTLDAIRLPNRREIEANIERESVERMQRDMLLQQDMLYEEIQRRRRERSRLESYGSLMGSDEIPFARDRGTNYSSITIDSYQREIERTINNSYLQMASMSGNIPEVLQQPMGQAMDQPSPKNPEVTVSQVLTPTEPPIEPKKVKDAISQLQVDD